MRNIILTFFLGCVFLSKAQTFSQVFNQTIPDDGSTVLYSIPVSGLPTSIDTAFGLEGICIRMTHTWDDDMEVKLKSPDGTTVLMFSHVGGDGDDFNVTCLNSVSPFPISSGTAPFNGAYRPMGDLGIFNNGQNPNGNWTLVVHDTYPFADQGFLIGWGVVFGTQPAEPFPFASSNLPIVKIFTQSGVVIPNEPKVEADFVIIDNGIGVRNYVSDTVFSYRGKMMVEQQGYSGPYYPKKNYDFDLIDTAGNKIDTSLLGMPAENDWILKAEYLDLSLMANPLTYEMSRRMGVYAPRTKYCEVMVNNEYVGVYSLTEKIKRDSNRVNIAKLNPQDTAGAELTGGYIIEMNINGDPPAWTSAYPPINNATCTNNVEFKEVYPKQDEIQPQQHNYIKSFVDSFELALQNDSIGSKTWRDFVSEKSFINFQIVNEFSANYDSYGRSTYMYKEKSTDGNKLHIGPPWDYDRAFVPGSESGWVWEITHPAWPFPFWWSKFNADSVYLKKMYCRWTELRMNTLSNDSFLTFVDSTTAMLQESAARNFLKWSELNVTQYTDAVAQFRSFIVDRLGWMDANILPHGAVIPVLVLADTTICSSAIVDANIGNQYSYEWSTGNTTSSITVLQSDIYSVRVEDEFGCSANSLWHITVSQPNAGFYSTHDSAFSFSFFPLDTVFSSYYWQFGDDSISGFVSPVHTYDTSGQYIVSLSVTDTLGCVDFFSDTVVVPSVINSVSNNNPLSIVKVYPNPFGDKLTIEIPDSKEVINLLLKDVTGKCVTQQKLTATKTEISSAGLDAGMYFLFLTSNKGYTYSLKLIRK